MDLIGETGAIASESPSNEVETFRNRTNASHPTRPQAKLENNTRIYIPAFIEQQRVWDKLPPEVECGT